ncbi:MAG: transcriptional regulator NrdR [Acidimicrobiia bacterium]|nr:transcriptional regulator NrdR [Acidimicrobiia bacterium]NNC74115.1 transcriptional repressor NrdR [Acidimicrobiia bacterium]
MRCSLCQHDDTRVVDSRPSTTESAIRRRRECTRCGHRFTTYERPVAAIVIKRDGSRQPFDAEKVRSGIERAIADRPVDDALLNSLVSDIETAAVSGAEISTEAIGRIILDGLRAADEVAYLRFASVYKEFTAPEDFEREVAALEEDASRA